MPHGFCQIQFFDECVCRRFAEHFSLAFAVDRRWWVGLSRKEDAGLGIQKLD